MSGRSHVAIVTSAADLLLLKSDADLQTWHGASRQRIGRRVGTVGMSSRRLLKMLNTPDTEFKRFWVTGTVWKRKFWVFLIVAVGHSSSGYGVVPESRSFWHALQSPLVLQFPSGDLVVPLVKLPTKQTPFRASLYCFEFCCLRLVGGHNFEDSQTFGGLTQENGLDWTRKERLCSAPLRSRSLFFMPVQMRPLLERPELYNAQLEPLISEQGSQESIAAVAALAAACTAVIGKERPTMAEVASVLQGVVLSERQQYRGTPRGVAPGTYAPGREQHDSSGGMLNDSVFLGR
jgi:hypothetical protein